MEIGLRKLTASMPRLNFFRYMVKHVCWLAKLCKINFNWIFISKALSLSLCYAIKIHDLLFYQSSHRDFKIYLPQFCLVQWDIVTLTDFRFYGSCLNLMARIIWMHPTWKRQVLNHKLKLYGSNSKMFGEFLHLL